MSEQQDKKRDIIRPYKVDGIEEYDNPMPRWWVGLFYGCIAFSAVYLGYYHFGSGSSLEDELKLEKERPAAEVAHSTNTNNGTALATDAPKAPLAERLKEADTIAAGKVIYDTNCFPCHGQHGEGGIGPNLTDNYWIHGGKPEDVIKTVAAGVPDKGMVSWQPILGDLKVEQVVAYLLTLQGTNPANAKAPQGELVQP